MSKKIIVILIILVFIVGLGAVSGIGGIYYYNQVYVPNVANEYIDQNEKSLKKVQNQMETSNEEFSGAYTDSFDFDSYLTEQPAQVKLEDVKAELDVLETELNDARENLESKDDRYTQEADDAITHYYDEVQKLVQTNQKTISFYQELTPVLEDLLDASASTPRPQITNVASMQAAVKEYEAEAEKYEGFLENVQEIQNNESTQEIADLSEEIIQEFVDFFRDASIAIKTMSEVVDDENEIAMLQEEFMETAKEFTTDLNDLQEKEKQLREDHKMEFEKLSTEVTKKGDEAMDALQRAKEQYQ